MSDDKNIKEEIIDVVNGNCAEDNAAHQKHTESAEEGDDSDAEVDRKCKFQFLCFLINSTYMII